MTAPSPPWQTETLVLASGSATRKAMLEAAGLAYEAIPSQVDEAVLKAKGRAAGQGVEATALDLARAKAAAVAKNHPARLVLGCDQMLECEGAWLDKATTREEAMAQLRQLSGRTHRLVSAACLVRGPEILWRHCAEARLTLRPLSGAFIAAYAARMGDHLLGSVGAYALEGLGSQLMETVAGDHFVILGLPLLPLQKQLRAMGILLS